MDKQQSSSKSSSDDPKYEINRISMQVNGNLMQSLYNLANKLSSQSESDSALQLSFKVRYKEVNNYKNGFQDAFTYLMAKCQDDNLCSELDKQLNKFYDMYYTTQVLWETMFSEQCVQSNIKQETHPSKSNQFNLPKITLPHFSGMYTEWPNFIAMFNSLIHDNCDISGIQKMHYLLSVLEKEPLHLIKHLGLSEQNYIIAYNILQDRYENKRLIADKHLESILSLNSLNSNQLNSGLKKLINCLKENIQALTALGFDTNSWSFILLHIILRKLPIELRTKFESQHCQSALSINDIPTFNSLLNFLETQLKVLESVSGTKNLVFSSNPSGNNNPSKSFIVQSSVTCNYCKGDHSIYTCEKFNLMTPTQRKEFILKNKLCFNCLRTHSIKKCQSQSKCQICHKRHHTKLHIDQVGHSSQPVNIETESASHGSSSQPMVNYNTQNGSTMLLGTAIVGIQDVNGHLHKVRALLDSGSQVTIITENLAQKLNLPRLSSTVLYGLGGSNAQQTRGSMECSISSLIDKSGSPLLTKAVILRHIMGALPSIQISPEINEKCKDLVLADAMFSVPGPIDMLIGIDIYNQVFDGRRMQLGDGLPTAHASIFGWVLMGHAPIHAFVSQQLPTLSCNVSLDTALSKFWELEDVPAIVMQDPEDLQCEKHFVDTHTRDTSGRFIVRLPFKTIRQPLGSTYEYALKRFNNLERKLQQNSQLKDLYVAFMKDYLVSGHMRPILRSMSSNRYYIPHHGVLKESSSTTKLRAVFDASAPSSSGISLNQVLMPGPKLQQNIEDIILRFRTHAIVFICDIKQMYRQVRLADEDCHYQTILWRESSDQPLQHFELITVTYGVSSAAYLAMRVIHELATLNEVSFPEVSRVLRQDAFVDDIISGSDSILSAKELQRQLIEVLAQGGFELRKWASNCDEVLGGYPSDHFEKPFRFDESGDNIFKVLGVEWNSRSDCFIYRVSDLPRCNTKRKILSNIARIYDPCGFLTPVTFYAKVLMQKLWVSKIFWDDPLPSEFSKLWDSFVEGFKLLKLPQIPRFIFSKLNCQCQLMGFCDASENGYAAVIYLRVQKSTRNVDTHLLLGKSRVAPIKQKLTIPRLELCGALLLARLISHTKSVLDKSLVTESVTAWCDSTIVLSWLRTPPHRLQTFEGNRVSLVSGLIPDTHWRYVPSALNPADCASRGVVASDLINHSLWWSPSWLKNDPSTWPSNIVTCNENLPGLKPNTSTSMSVSKVDGDTTDLLLINRFSSLSRLQRVIAWIFRFTNYARKSTKKLGSLSAHELNFALNSAVRVVQQRVFATEIKTLLCKRSLKGPLARLDPFLDSDCLLRVGGRLKHSNLSFHIKHPLLLPKAHHLTNLIIDYHHQLYLHVGPSSLISILRQRFWILSARQVVRHRVFHCQRCRRIKAKPLEPLMGNLPASRVRQARPFQRVGIDFAGPFCVKSSTTRSAQRSKAYLCVYICLTVKAVHLEVVSDLTTEAFLASFHRFVSRRGMVSNIISDCGKNFQGAKRHLSEVESFLSQNAKGLDSNFAKLGVNWHMNPPYAPHMAGMAESAVKSAKTLLTRTIGEQVLTFEELYTVCTRVEAILNSRPICPASDDDTGFDVLTPGHFLIGESLLSVPEYDYDHTPISPLKRWKLVQQISQHLWQRWQREYLHNLQQRTKWCKSSPNIKIGDLVLIKEDNVPPLRWRLGRVSALHPGSDGVVRVVDIKTSTGSCLRSVTKICPLHECDT